MLEIFRTVELLPDPLGNRLAANSVGSSHNEDEFQSACEANLGQENVQIRMQTPLQQMANRATLFGAKLVGNPARIGTHLCHHDGDGTRLGPLAECRGQEVG